LDHGGYVCDLWLPAGAELEAADRPDLLGGVVVVTGRARAQRRRDAEGPVTTEPVTLTAVPYCVWDNREAGEMAVWIPTSPDLAEVVPSPTLASTSRASASHCFEHDTVAALNDQLAPARSSDHSIPRLTWWDHLGTTEWAQYDFAAPTRVSGAAVYWFDDTGIGRCRLPRRWRLLYRAGDGWLPVTGASAYGLAADAFNEVRFDPVETTALRLEVQLAEGFSGGILEWTVRAGR
jgi:hypothetical protein